MRYIYIYFAILAIIAYSDADGAFNYVIHERRNSISPIWQKRSFTRPTEVEASQPITMRIALKHENLHLAENHVMDISHPHSAAYGKHWTIDQVADTFAPSHEAITIVKSWLTAEGIAEHRIS